MDKTEAMQRFDLSVQGFWRSFYALLIVIPLGLAGLLTISLLSAGSTFLQTGEIFTEWRMEPNFLAIGYALAVILPALHLAAFAYITGRFSNRSGVRETYTGFITVRNWATVVLAGFRSAGRSADASFWLCAAGVRSHVCCNVFGYWDQFRVARLVAPASLPVSFGLIALEYAPGALIAIIPTFLVGIIVALVI